MADYVRSFGPDGSPIQVPADKVNELIKSGGRVMSEEDKAATDARYAAEAKRNAPIDVSPGDIAEMYGAALHADVRGVAGAFGVPIDSAITGVAETFGGDAAGASTAKYLRDLEEKHPYITGWMEAMGGARGAIGAAEAVGAPGRLSQGLLPRTAAGVASRAAYVGAENVVQQTTRDLDEDAIGNASTNGQKLLAAMPKHFAVGAALGLAGEGLGAAAESGVAALTRRAEPALEAAATRAVGREVGAEGEAAAAAGQRVREAAGGQVPRSRGALMQVLETEQARQRAANAAEHAARVGDLETEHIVQVAKQAERGVAGREAVAQRGRMAVEEVEGSVRDRIAARRAETSAEAFEMKGRYDDLKATLKTERASAEDTVQRLGKEREKLEKELSALTKKHNADKYDPDEAADLIAGFMGRKTDPNFRWAIGPTLDREASRAVEGASSSAASEIERLNTLYKGVARSHEVATEHLAEVNRVEGVIDGVFQKELERFVAAGERDVSKIAKAGEKEVGAAKRASTAEGAKYERQALKDEAALDRAQAKEIRDQGKPKTETDVDKLIAGAKETAAKGEEKPLLSPGAGLGAVWTILHGHPLGGAAALLGNIASNRVRSVGNMNRAAMYSSIASKLRTVDAAVKDGAASLFGAAASRAARGLDRDDDVRVKEIKPIRRPQTFEGVAKSVRDAQGNPSLVERHVQAQMGSAVLDAPQTYAQVLAASMRAQHFLESMLPAKQTDPLSLRPDLSRGDVSDTEKYDFMQYARTIENPLDVFKDVRDGSVTSQQIDAIKFVFPDLYSQMRAEVQWQNMMATKPLDYEKQIHVGTLLGVTTDQVLEPDYQAYQKAAFEQKEEDNAPVGSRSPGGESKLSKDYMSASQQAEKGSD